MAEREVTTLLTSIAANLFGIATLGAYSVLISEQNERENAIRSFWKLWKSGALDEALEEGMNGEYSVDKEKLLTVEEFPKALAGYLDDSFNKAQVTEVMVAPTVSTYIKTFMRFFLGVYSEINNTAGAIGFFLFFYSLKFPFKQARMLRMAAYYTDIIDEKDSPDYVASAWLPPALKGKGNVKRLDSYALRRPMEIKANISNPEYDDRYSIKSVISCIIAGVQVISTTVNFCMRLVNVNSVHTLDVIVMFTSWILFCQIILTLLAPAYYTRPIVYIPTADLTKYCTVDDITMSKTRITIANLIRYHSRKLWLALLCLPIVGMLAILLFVNRDNVFLCVLSAIWVALLIISAIAHYIVHIQAFRVMLGFLIFVSFFFLIIKSCFVTTAEQRYTDAASWLPHF